MKIKNPLLLSAFTVYSFWYFVAQVPQLVMYPSLARFAAIGYAYSVAAVLIGAGIGLWLTLGFRYLSLHFSEREIKAGHSHRGLNVSLGRVPGAASETMEKAP